MIVNKKPRIEDVMEWLTDEYDGISYNMSAKWRLLGSALGLSENTLNGIEKAASRQDADCLHRLLSHWISNSRSCNWKTLINALKGGIVQNRITADYIIKRLGEDKIFQQYVEYHF